MVRDETRLVIAASATGAVFAMLMGELVRRVFSRREQPQWTQTLEDALMARMKEEMRMTPEDTAERPPTPPPRLERCKSLPAVGRERSMSDGDGLGSQFLQVPRHTEDAALRALNVNLMERGRASNARAVGQMWGPKKTKVVRICLTGGPCAGKSSALEHLIDRATKEGFDVLTAPEVATLYFNSSYQFPNPSSATFMEQKFAFQRNVLKLQLQMERCYCDLAGSSGRPTIVVFDRGLRDGLAFMAEEEWPLALEELNREMANGPVGRITDKYIYERYDGVIHLVTAADGAEEFYRFGIVEDDSGGKVFRRETPAEAVEQDQKLREVWVGHPRHIVVSNGSPCSFQGKLEEATEAVLAIARLAHPDEMRRAKVIREERKQTVKQTENQA